MKTVSGGRCTFWTPGYSSLYSRYQLKGPLRRAPVKRLCTTHLPIYSQQSCRRRNRSSGSRHRLGQSPVGHPDDRSPGQSDSLEEDSCRWQMTGWFATALARAQGTTRSPCSTFRGTLVGGPFMVGHHVGGFDRFVYSPCLGAGLLFFSFLLFFFSNRVISSHFGYRQKRKQPNLATEKSTKTMRILLYFTKILCTMWHWILL